MYAVYLTELTQEVVSRSSDNFTMPTLPVRGKWSIRSVSGASGEDLRTFDRALTYYSFEACQAFFYFVVNVVNTPS